MIGLLQGFEEQAEEDIGGEQDQGEDDGASQAAPCAHAVGFFLFRFFLVAGLLLGGRLAAVTGQAGRSVGRRCLFHACFVGWWCFGMIFGRSC